MSTGNEWETEDGDGHVGMDGGGDERGLGEIKGSYRQCRCGVNNQEAVRWKEGKVSCGFVIISATAREQDEKILRLSVLYKD